MNTGNRNRQPWLPQKPKLAVKCKRCRGTGKVQTFSTFRWAAEDHDCTRCGGKGYL